MKTGWKRLLKLADYLDTVQPKHFNMRDWSVTERCGTVACAAGHACQMPGFKRLGLRLVEDEDDGTLIPVLGDSKDSDASLMVFFDLEVEDLDKIFYSYAKTPKQESYLIRQIVGRLSGEKKKKTKVTAEVE